MMQPISGRCQMIRASVAETQSNDRPIQRRYHNGISDFVTEAGTTSTTAELFHRQNVKPTGADFGGNMTSGKDKIK